MSEKRLVKGEKKLFGVCSGIADYFGWDPTIVRLGFIITSVVYGFGLLAYILGIIVIPEE